MGEEENILGDFIGKNIRRLGYILLSCENNTAFLSELHFICSQNLKYWDEASDALFATQLARLKYKNTLLNDSGCTSVRVSWGTCSVLPPSI